MSSATEEVALEARAARRRLPALGVLGGLVHLTLAAVSLGSLRSAPEVEAFVLVFASIAIEALPFILLGAAVSAAIAAFVSDAVFARIARLPVPLQIPGACLGGGPSGTLTLRADRVRAVPPLSSPYIKLY